MKAAIIISAIVLAFVAIGMIPICIKVASQGKGKDIRAMVCICILHIPVRTIMLVQKGASGGEKPTDGQAQKKQKKKSKGSAEAEKKEKQGIGDVLELVKLLIGIAKKVLKRTWRCIRIKIECYDITIGTDDAAKTALIYGGVSQATSHLFTLLDETAHFSVKRKAPVNVGVDFLATETRASIQMAFCLRLWHIFSIGSGAVVSYLLGIKKSSAGAKNENADNNIKINEDEKSGKAE